MGKQGVLIILLLITIIPFISAEIQTLGTVKQGDCINLPQTYMNSTYCNITKIIYPNKTSINVQWEMTRIAPDYNYTFCDTNISGQYQVTTCLDIDGADPCIAVAYDFLVTGNGKDNASGNVIIIFAVVFIGIMFFLLYELIACLGHFASLDLDVLDLAKCIGTYFVLLALYWLETFYLGNLEMERWLLMFIYIGGFTHLLIPLVGFVISITVGSLRKKQVDFGVKRILRRQQI